MYPIGNKGTNANAKQTVTYYVVAYDKVTNSWTPEMLEYSLVWVKPVGKLLPPEFKRMSTNLNCVHMLLHENIEVYEDWTCAGVVFTPPPNNEELGDMLPSVFSKTARSIVVVVRGKCDILNLWSNNVCTLNTLWLAFVAIEHINDNLTPYVLGSSDLRHTTPANNFQIEAHTTIKNEYSTNSNDPCDNPLVLNLFKFGICAYNNFTTRSPKREVMDNRNSIEVKNRDMISVILCFI
jgi:hypothetical protein